MIGEILRLNLKSGEVDSGLAVRRLVSRESDEREAINVPDR